MFSLNIILVVYLFQKLVFIQRNNTIPHEMLHLEHLIRVYTVNVPTSIYKFICSERVNP